MDLLPYVLVAYLVGIVLTAICTFYPSRIARRAAALVVVLTWFGHLAVILWHGHEQQRMPLANMAEFLLVLGWAVLTLDLYVWFRLRVQIAGLLLPPVAALAAFGAWGLWSEAHETETRLAGWFLFHTTVSTIGMAILCVAFAMSVLYLFKDYALKAKKNLAWLGRLPALEQCDRVGFHAMWIGFLLLSIGIGTGLVLRVGVDVPAAKAIFPLLAWLLFAAVIGSRRWLGYRGRKSAYLTIAGFALGLLTVLGMRP